MNHRKPNFDENLFVEALEFKNKAGQMIGFVLLVLATIAAASILFPAFGAAALIGAGLVGGTLSTAFIGGIIDAYFEMSRGRY